MLKDPTISATEFKEKCLSILDTLGPQGLIVTKRGKAIAKIVPISTARNESLIGSMKGKIEIKGDLLSTGMNWHAESGHAHRRRSARRKSKKS